MATYSSTYIFPQEGLNQILNVYPRGTVAPSGTYIGLFTTPWSTISGYMANMNTYVTLNSGTYSVAEVSGTGGGGYARQLVASGAWNAPVNSSIVIAANTISGQQVTTSSGFLFTCTSGTWSAVNGIFISTWSTLNGSSNPAAAYPNVVLWYAPFSDANSVTIASGDSLQVTPTWQTVSFPA